MLVTHKSQSGTRRLRAIAVAVPCVACMLAIPAQASETQGNKCGHFKFELRQANLTAGVALSRPESSKCAPPTITPPDSGSAPPPGGTPSIVGGGGSAEDPSGSRSVPVLKASVLLFSGKSVGVPLACPAAAPANCIGRILIRITTPTKRTRARSAGVHAARRGRKLNVGKASFRVAPGREKTIAVRISRRGRMLFNNKKNVRAEVRIESRDSAGRKHVTRRSVRVKRATSARR